MTSGKAVSLDRVGLRGPRIKYWVAYVAAFYVAWLLLAFVYGHWEQIKAHWPISLVMIFGSLVAGSTPMGGGTVAFPFLVLVFNQPPSMGRNFAFVIQALGMTSAMIFILCRRAPIQLRVLLWAALGSAAGLLVGTFAIAPVVTATTVKLLFSCLWMSFGLLTIAKNSEFCALTSNPKIDPRQSMITGLVVGLSGGIVASLIGVGVEMMLYTILVLHFRCDLKVAVPTAVSAMAVASVLATALHLYIGDISMEVFHNWLAAGPIVVFGAPAGTFLVSVIPRIRTLYFVSFLCVVQFVWTLYQVKPGRAEWSFVVVAMAVAGLVFYRLYLRGRSRAARESAPRSTKRRLAVSEDVPFL